MTNTTFNIYDNRDLLIMEMTDNGEWEYDRLGIGSWDGRLFMVDIDDTGEDDRDINWVRPELTLRDLLAAGTEHMVFSFDDEGVYRFNMDGECNWDAFVAEVCE